MSLCTATTAAGHPCKNHAVKGSQLCKAHGGHPLGGSALDIRHGAPVGNTNAVKHGFYRNVISEKHYARLLVYAEQFDLVDELALTRVRLNDIVDYINEHRSEFSHDDWVKHNNLYFTGIRTVADLVAKLDGRRPDHWDLVLNQLSIDLGMDL
jgi:hypothetical protein